MQPSQLSRRNLLRYVTYGAGALAALPVLSASTAPLSRKARPVILTTDIGDDIDDTWALGFLLKCPELDLKLVVGDYGKQHYRAKLLAKFLETVGRSEIPIGMGVDGEPRGDGPQGAWVKDYDLGTYPGRVHTDGVQAMIDTVMRSPDPVTIIAIGPMPNVATALEREPRIAQVARFVGMDGSIRKGYGASATPTPEWNVKANPKACQKAFTASWPMTITPLDTCGVVKLDGDRYRRVRESRSAIASTIVENYRIWSQANKQPLEWENHSSVLFDTVAVYLAFSQDFCTMERLGIRVTDDGSTLIDKQAKKVNVATDWKSLNGYLDLLVNRLTS
jgi:inosine-uridine nucleoside N-ribohydrolase